ncbi:MAG: DUF1801 domain-containing protein [Chloroflexi bacterium]|nr:DUF1801 domain-containing protein [Chloroflexota bacterium]
MTASELIDQKIAELGDWRGEFFAQLREMIRAADPEIVEEWKWDTAVWSRHGLICAVGAFKSAVKVNFFKGASLQDPDNLFNAGLDAKATRAIDLHEGDALEEAALTRLMRAAVAHNLTPKK